MLYAISTHVCRYNSINALVAGEGTFTRLLLAVVHKGLPTRSPPPCMRIALFDPRLLRPLTYTPISLTKRLQSPKNIGSWYIPKRKHSNGNSENCLHLKPN